MRLALIPVAVIAVAGPALAEDRTVYFDFDKSIVDARGQAEVDAAAADYAASGDTAISVVGHTDTSGSAAYNMALSERRANAVAASLEAQGVPADQITLAWRGEAETAVATGDGVREPLNRRAEIGMASFEPVAPAAPEIGRLSLGFGPYVGINLQEHQDSVALGVNLLASYAVHPNFALSAEQAIFYNINYHGANTTVVGGKRDRDNGVGGRTAIGADVMLGDLGGINPYVGVNAGVTYVDGSFDDGFFYGPEVGFDIYGVQAKVAYDIYPERDLDDNVISITLGYGLRF